MDGEGSDMAHQHQTYCKQLLLDCDDPIFQGHLFRGRKGGPTKKMRDLESPNSEDAVTWSIFRLLERHFADQPWLAGLLGHSPRAGLRFMRRFRGHRV